MSEELKNPHIENFCRALIDKKGEKLSQEGKDKLAEDLYFLYENLLGRNMVAALPEDVRKEYVAKFDKGARHVDFEEIGRTFSGIVANPDEIMKKTLKELEDLYFRNR